MNLRPQTLDEFTGQEQAKKILRVLISAAKKRGEPVSHILMSGGPGLGKSSLARIVAGVRKHLGESHSYENRIQELIGIIDS